MSIPYTSILAIGRTVAGVNLPLLCGPTGALNDGSAGDAPNVGPKDPTLVYGRTAGGVNIPIRVDASGIVQFA